MRTFAFAGLIAALGAAVAPMLAHAGGAPAGRGSPGAEWRSVRLARLDQRTGRSGRQPLVFGIYPGGAAGVVGPGASVKPEDPAKRMDALQRLRPPGAPLMIRLYPSYTGRDGPSAAEQLAPEVAAYTQAGFEVELALTYRPHSGGGRADVAGFVDFVRATVDAFGANPRFASLQVTNEVNVGGAPNVADGYYAGARDALLDGVIAAKQEIRKRSFKQLKVGFNWAYVTVKDEHVFWTYLGKHGGAQFRRALDWVGFDVYPGTWGPPLGGGSLERATASFIAQALHRLETNLRIVGIPAGVALHVSESGYPTGPNRTEAMQAESMRASIDAVNAARGRYNITNYTWFDLRDADSGSGNFQNQYGIVRDDYSPKPAFELYRSLIGKLSLG